MSSHLSETWCSARANGHCFWLVRDTWPIWAVTRATLQLVDRHHFPAVWLELISLICLSCRISKNVYWHPIVTDTDGLATWSDGSRIMCDSDPNKLQCESQCCVTTCIYLGDITQYNADGEKANSVWIRLFFKFIFIMDIVIPFLDGLCFFFTEKGRWPYKSGGTIDIKSDGLHKR